MMDIEDVAALAAALPEVTEGTRYGHRTWFVAGKAFAWERPFHKADIKRYGDETPPDGPILAIATADLGEKDAILAAELRGFFTIAHFADYPAILVQLTEATDQAVRDALLDGWLACAPPAVAAEHYPDGV